MMDLNRVVLMGRVVRTPKSRTLPSGEVIARFSVATNYSIKGASPGEKPAGVDFHELIAWGGLAKLVLDRVVGGLPVYVEGRLRTREYVTRLGSKARASEVVLSRILLGHQPKAAEPSEAST